MTFSSGNSAGFLPYLEEGERALVELAADTARDVVAPAVLGDREGMILQLYHRAEEQKLERALAHEVLDMPMPEGSEEELATAEQALLEARATYTVRRKAVGTVLMTEPSLKAVHGKATSAAERALFRLINQRDVLSLVHESLHAAQRATIRELSSLEVENRRVHESNRVLARRLLDLTEPEGSWREQLDDPELQGQLAALEKEQRQSQAQWAVMKNIVSAVVVGSGVDWTDERLTGLVLDDSP